MKSKLKYLLLVLLLIPCSFLFTACGTDVVGFWRAERLTFTITETGQVSTFILEDIAEISQEIKEEDGYFTLLPETNNPEYYLNYLKYSMVNDYANLFFCRIEFKADGTMILTNVENNTLVYNGVQSLENEKFSFSKKISTLQGITVNNHIAEGIKYKMDIVSTGNQITLNFGETGFNMQLVLEKQLSD